VNKPVPDGGCDRRDHWQKVHAASPPESKSWHRAHLDTSLALIGRAGITRAARIIDVGGGASTLVDDLLSAGHRSITVLDISARALDLARLRLGDLGRGVRWMQADIVDASLDEDAYDLWHDRATLHFLDAAERQRYVEVLRRALAPGGHVILATFAPDGPERCSGLPVKRGDAEALQRLLGDHFAIREACHETHVTPSGHEQRFAYCRLQQTGGIP